MEPSQRWHAPVLDVVGGGLAMEVSGGWAGPDDGTRQPPARAASLLLLLLLRACGRLTHYLQTHYILNTHYIVNPQALNNRNVFNRAVLPVCRLFMCQYSGCFDKHMKNTILSQVLKIFLKSTIFALWPKMRFEMKLDTFLDKKKIVHNFAAFS